MFVSLYLDAYIRVWRHEEQIKSAFEIPAIYRPVSAEGCRAKARRMTSRDAEREHEAVKRRVRVERDRREAMHYLSIHISLFFFIHYSSSSFSAHSSSCSSVTFILSSSFSCTVSTSQSSTPSCLTSSSPSLLSCFPPLHPLLPLGHLPPPLHLLQSAFGFISAVFIWPVVAAIQLSTCGSLLM